MLIDRAGMSVEERVQAEAAEKTARQQRIRESNESDWENVHLQNSAFKMATPPANELFAVNNLPHNSTFFDIFNKFLPRSLLEDIWRHYPRNHWHYRSAGSDVLLLHGLFDYKAVLTMFAIYIRIMGLQIVPSNQGGKGRQKRDAIVEALNYFNTKYPDAKFLGRETYELLISHFCIPSEFYEQISSNFRSILIKLGEVIVGDEKLLKFTGDSRFVRSVPAKPDSIGLWHFELACKYPNGDPFLIHMKFSNSTKRDNIHIPVNEVVKQWADISKAQHHKPVVVFDSYYTDQQGREYLKAKKVPFIGAVIVSRFNLLSDILEEYGDKIRRDGDKAAIYNPRSKELFVHKRDRTLGDKYVISNAFHHAPATRKTDNVTPVYDHYRQAFNICDVFNGHDLIIYPHKCGGKSVSGLNGNISKFVMGAVLENVFNSHRNIRGIAAYNMSAQDKYCALSDQIVEYTLTL